MSFICSCDKNNKSKEAFLIELISENEPRDICNLHNNNKLILFCKDCNAQICEECNQAQHQNHTTDKNKIILDDELARKIFDIGDANKDNFKGYEILKKIYEQYKILDENKEKQKFYDDNDLEISQSRGYAGYAGIDNFSKIKTDVNPENGQKIDKEEPIENENPFVNDFISNNNNIQINNKIEINNNIQINSVGGYGSNIVLGNTTKGKEIDPNNIKCIKILKGHENNIVSLIQLSSGYLATGAYDFSICIWDIEQGQCIRTFYDVGKIFCLLEFRPNLLLAGTSENNISLWEIDKSEDSSTFNFCRHSLWVNSIVKCDEQYFASASNDACIIIWDFDKRETFTMLSGHTNSILCMIKLNDGNLCSGAADCVIKIWDWKKNICIMELIGHENWVKCLYQLDDNTILSGSDDKTIKVWQNYHCVATLAVHNHSVRTLCKINDNYFASGSFDQTINIWNSQNFKLVNTLYAHESRVICIIKLKDNKLATCSNDKTIKIWE